METGLLELPRRRTDIPNYVDDDHGIYLHERHVRIDLNSTQWMSAAKQVLDYDDFEVAWTYEGGGLYLWGENLDRSTLRKLRDGIEQCEGEFASNGEYNMAEWASRAANRVRSATIDEPNEPPLLELTEAGPA